MQEVLLCLTTKQALARRWFSQDLERVTWKIWQDLTRWNSSNTILPRNLALSWLILQDAFARSCKNDRHAIFCNHMHLAKTWQDDLQKLFLGLFGVFTILKIKENILYSDNIINHPNAISNHNYKHIIPIFLQSLMRSVKTKLRPIAANKVLDSCLENNFLLQK